MSSARVVGLAGGIASGKSTVSRWLRGRGLLHVDADQIARDVVAPQSQGLAAVVDRFGRQYLTSTGQLDRAALGALVFSQPIERRALEAILHPLIIEAIDARVAAMHARATALLDAALLLEMGMADRCDLVVVVSCPVAVQIERMRLRDGLGADAAQARVDAQMSDEQRRALADWVVDNSGTLDELEGELERLWRHLVERGMVSS